MSPRFFVVGILLMLALSFTPLLAQTTPADHYECAGDDVTVTYSTTSFTGEPGMTIQLGRETISRSGTEIQTQDTVLGSLVTVVRKQAPDSFTDTVTLVAPGVNVTDQNPRVGFTTRLFLTRTRTSIAGPRLVEGVIQKSTTKSLFCTASSVTF